MASPSSKARHPSFAPIVGERISLRLLRPEDAPLLVQYLNNWNVVRFLSEVPYPYTSAAAEGFIAHSHKELSLRQQFNLGIEMRAPRRLIGIIGLVNKPAEPEIGYWLGEDFWGQGYGSEAMRLMIGFIGDTLRLPEIYSSAADENKASLRVLEKAGFKFIDFSIRNFPARGQLVRVANYKLQLGAK